MWAYPCVFIVAISCPDIFAYAQPNGTLSYGSTVITALCTVSATYDYGLSRQEVRCESRGLWSDTPKVVCYGEMCKFTLFILHFI